VHFSSLHLLQPFYKTVFCCTRYCSDGQITNEIKSNNDANQMQKVRDLVHRTTNTYNGILMQSHYEREMFENCHYILISSRKSLSIPM